MKNISERFLYLGIWGPIGVMALWIVSQWHVSQSGLRVILPIKGFDPRSLLSGQYLSFAVDYGLSVRCAGKVTDYCVCVDGLKDGHNYATGHGGCNSMVGCRIKIRGTCDSSGFKAGLERFYFPEDGQNLLKTVPRDSTVVVSVTAGGTATILDLRVAGVPLTTWLQQQR